MEILETAFIESAIGITFNKKDLLWEALTHSTYARYTGTPDTHNEWLAVLGDTLLDFIVLDYLYEKFGNTQGKGFLSIRRDEIVSDANLEKLAYQIKLPNFILVKNQDDQVTTKNITEAFEALLAVIYLDKTWQDAYDWFITKFIDSSFIKLPVNAALSNSFTPARLADIQTAIGIVFHHPSLLETALTTISYARNTNYPENHNEGLSVLGDTLLDFIALDYLYRNKNSRRKGVLSDDRDLLVRDSTLELIIQQIKLHQFIQHNTQSISDDNLTNTFEALLAAVYFDRGLDAARDWFFHHLPAQVNNQLKILLYQDVSGNINIAQEELFSSNSLKSATGVDYSTLQEFLRQGEWEKADFETRNVMLKVIGRVDYLPLSYIDEFSCEDLQIINQLWLHYSQGRFGFSVQNRILKDVEYDWDKFGERIGWKVGENWRSKNDRIFSLQAPEGHLPSAAIRAAGNGPKARMRIYSRVEHCNL